jgi:hypothetical protein
MRELQRRTDIRFTGHWIWLVSDESRRPVGCTRNWNRTSCAVYHPPMNGQDFLRLANEAFGPFLKELGFSMDAPSISGRLYRASFNGPKHSVSVSFEPGDNAFFVLVFSRANGELSEMDDRLKTPRLSDLNSHYMNMVSSEERAANESAFQSVVARDAEEGVLLKSAKELRLVLPKYLGDQGH